MKIVYIAGKYSGADYHEIDRNIGLALEAAAWCANHGLGFFCPHLHSAHFEVITPDVPETFWYELDLYFLDHCDVLLLLDGWENSRGAKNEHRYWLDNYPNRPAVTWQNRDRLIRLADMLEE